MIRIEDSLFSKFPELAKEWHPTKNGKLTPKDVTVFSGKKVWWLLPYDDPVTGKHFDFEWKSRIVDRVKGNGCPYLCGKAVWIGFNDLESQNPELAREWHPIKNGELTPRDVTANSNKRVWWLLRYNDPNTGKLFEFEWEAEVCNRLKGNGCPYLCGRAVWIGFNDLESQNPELAREWHPIKNGELTPRDVMVNSNKKVWWLLRYNDPNTGKQFEFEWEAIISSRSKGNGCPYLCGKAVWIGFNDLESQNPELAREWHPTKNGKLTPSDVTVNSHKKVWWLLPYDDPVTGKHYEFEWSAKISNRALGNGCPYLCGRAVWIGFNDLESQKPELTREWHPTKNGKLKPSDVTVNSLKVVWWYLSYDDPNTGKHFDFEWKESISNRVKGYGCPYLSGKAVWLGFNDLESQNPELAREWHPIKNGELTPRDVTANSNKRVWWLLRYNDPNTGNHFEFEWKETICNRHRKKYGCPFLSNRIVWPGYNDLATLDPELAQEWHPTKNGKLTPRDVVYTSIRKVWWLLSYDDSATGKHFDFSWKAEIRSRVHGEGCPYLSGNAAWPGFNDLETVNPDLAKEWHHTKNRNLTPQKVTAFSNKKVWWCCEKGHIWRTSIHARAKGCGCQECYKNNNV